MILGMSKVVCGIGPGQVTGKLYMWSKQNTIPLSCIVVRTRALTLTTVRSIQKVQELLRLDMAANGYCTVQWVS